MKGRLVRSIAAVVVSAGLLALLLARLELGPALERFVGADPRAVAVAGLFSLVVLLLRALRFSALTRSAGLGVTTPAIAIQVFLNRITPLRLGELSLPLLLQRHGGETFSGALLGLLFVRLLDLAILVWAVALSVAVRPEGAGAWSLAAASLVLVVVLGTFRHWVGGLVRLLARATAPLAGRRLARIPAAVERLAAAAGEIRRLDGKGHAAVALSSLGIFLGQTAMFGAILAAYGIRLPALDLIRGAAVAQGGAALPIAAVGTVGTQEAAWVAGYAWVGVPLQDAIVTGVAAQLFTLAFAALFALPAWTWLSLRRPGVERG